MSNITTECLNQPIQLNGEGLLYVSDSARPGHFGLVSPISGFKPLTRGELIAAVGRAQREHAKIDEAIANMLRLINRDL